MKYAECAYCKGKEKCADPEQRCTDYNLVDEITALKDQQFKEYLEFRKIECLRTAKIVYAYDMSSAGELEIKAKCYDQIINELFKKD